MLYKKVAVLYGGCSSEREVSLNSGRSIFEALTRNGIKAELFDTAEKNIFTLKSSGFDVAFIALHGGAGENGEVQAALELMDIPFTGSKMKACVLADDKYLSKLIWKLHQLPVPETIYLTNETSLESVKKLGFPLFLKPNSEGSSIGVYKIYNEEELSRKYQKLSQKYPMIMAETFLSGGEFTCPIIGDEAFPVIKIEPANDFYDYEAKYLRNDTVYHCPAGLTDEEEKIARDLSLRAFKALGGQGWGRVDLMKDQTGQFYLLEVNNSPGMTNHSLVPKSAEVYGLSFDELCLKILSYAI